MTDSKRRLFAGGCGRLGNLAERLRLLLVPKTFLIPFRSRQVLGGSIERIDDLELFAGDLSGFGKLIEFLGEPFGAPLLAARR